MNTFHKPVMVDQVVSGLEVRTGSVIVDATVGGGGHTKALLAGGAFVFGIDADSEALEHTKALLHQSGFTQFKLRQGNFRQILTLAQKNGIQKADGVLFDLGVSSHQLDTPRRGFTYRDPNAQLDMRFDQAHGRSAADLIGSASKEELYEIFSAYGEEKHSRTIADTLYRANAVKPIRTVGAVREAITGVVAPEEAEKALKRIFQALRIAVNDEFGALRSGLAGAEELMKTGGRLAVISFHSREDRITKLWMKRNAWRVVTKKPMVATVAECRQNPRSRSAKLRIAERI